MFRIESKQKNCKSEEFFIPLLNAQLFCFFLVCNINRQINFVLNDLLFFNVSFRFGLPILEGITADLENKSHRVRIQQGKRIFHQDATTLDRINCLFTLQPKD